MFADAAEHAWLEELGGMNVYLVTTDDELITPELTGSILEGVTRDSILTLATEFGLTPVERRISLAEMLEGIASGQVTEMFACGTAAVITPIGMLKQRRGRRTPSAPARPARPPPRCARRCWTSSTAAPRTPTAGCAGSPDVALAQTQLPGIATPRRPEKCGFPRKWRRGAIGAELAVARFTAGARRLAFSAPMRDDDDVQHSVVIIR